MILNLGCGVNKVPGAVNIDLHGNPDVRANILFLPFGNGTVDKIYLFHTIEHIKKALHHDLFTEIRRVLKQGGQLFVSYPEFTKCAQNFIDNKFGWRDFWSATIYGRQLQPNDFHVTLMYTPYFTRFLKDMGFDSIRTSPEPTEDFNTVVKCVKATRPPNIIERYKRDYFGINVPYETSNSAKNPS